MKDFGGANSDKPAVGASSAGLALLHVRHCRLVVLAVVAPVGLFLPLSIFLQNTIEFSVGFFHIAGLFLLLNFILGVAFYLLATAWPSLIVPPLVFLSLGFFVESTLLFPLAGHRPFDGTLIDWTRYSILPWVEMVVLAAVLGLSVALLFRGRLLHTVLLFVLFFQSVGFGVTLISRWDVLVGDGTGEAALNSYFTGFHRLSSERNVIEIVADHTQGSLVYEVFQANLERYSRVFDGFTLFVQASGRYSGTYPSVPYLMTGRAPEIGLEIRESIPFTHDYVQDVLTRDSIVRALAEEGFSTYGYQVNVLYCAGDYEACIPGSIFSGRPVASNLSGSLDDAARTLIDVTLFRVSPIWIRRSVYNDEQWLLRRPLAAGAPTISSVMDFLVERMSVSNLPGNYNFIHHAGGHPPIQFDRQCRLVPTRPWDYESTFDQVACTLLQLERLIERLKELGIYDQTMIILAGDHGSQWPTELMGERPGRLIPPRIISAANPALLIKPPGARGELQFSFAPASLGDLPQTIARAFGLQRAFPGEALQDLEEDESRERLFVWFPPSPEIFHEQVLPRSEPYRIRGNLFDQADWLPPLLSGIHDAPVQLTMDAPRLEELSQGLSEIQGQSRPARWVDGRLARFYLSAPQGQDLRLYFDCYLPPTIPSQSIKVMVNGQIVAELSDEELRSGTYHEVGLPKGPEPGSNVVVEFLAENTVSLPNDGRLLSILFLEVGLNTSR